ncbi:MAG: DUF6760 family protein [Mastigocoleus sp.]
MTIVGGIISYPSEQLHEEVACIAFEFHWSLEEIINLEHSDRRRWVGEIGKLRQRISDES